MQKFDIRDWVNQHDDYRAFRQAVHIILTAIAGTHALQTSMIMKGGVLLALSYNSPRYTKDIDFSTSLRRPDIDLEEFQRLFNESLSDTVEELGYRRQDQLVLEIGNEINRLVHSHQHG